MSRHTTKQEEALIDEIIEAFISRCNYVGTNTLRSQLKGPARGASGICKELNMDADAYIVAHVMYAPILRGYSSLVPGQIYSRDSKIYAERFKAESNSYNPQDFFEAQCRIFATCLEHGWDQVLCLSNPSFDFMPWFRILMAPDSNKELIDKYGAAAAHTLNHDKPLADYLKTIKADDGSSFDFGRIPNFKP